MTVPYSYDIFASIPFSHLTEILTTNCVKKFNDLCTILCTQTYLSTQNTQQDLSYKTSLYSILTQCRGYRRLSYRLNSSSGLSLGIFGRWWLPSSGSLMVSLVYISFLHIIYCTFNHLHANNSHNIEISIFLLKFVSQICMDTLRNWCGIFS